MTVSSGVAMEIHYCMGQRAGVDFYKTEKDKCSRCGMKEKKGGCCSDEHKFYKLANEHKNVFNEYHAFIFPSIVINNSVLFPGKFVSPVEINILQKGAPPGQDLPVFIRNCVFRI